MANTKVTGDLIASGTITAANLVSGTLDTLLNGYLTTNAYATQSYVTTAVSNLIDAAPASLDTLNELAAALNDDANFATTVTNALATKLNLSGGNITGNLSVDTDTFYVDSANNRVGIGIGSPTTALDVRSGDTSTQITIGASNGGTYGRLYADNDGDLILGADAGDNAANSYMGFEVDNTEYMRINSSGNVGIGTSSPDTIINAAAADNTILRLESTDTSPSADQKLGGVEFYGNGSILGAGVYGSLNGFYEDTAGRSYLTLSTRASTGLFERVRINSNGNVGIGVSDPEFPISLANDKYIAWKDSIGNFTKAIKATSDNALQFYNVSERMRITSTGNVGIGTSSPAERLHLYQSAANNELLRIEQGSSATGSQIQFINPHNSSCYLGVSGNTDGDFIYYNGAATNNIFYTSGTERMRITSIGIVNIGTSATLGGSENTNIGHSLYANGTYVSARNSTAANIYIAKHTGAAGEMILFSVGGNDVGSIDTTTTSTSYNTSSDYRLKENVVPMEGALDRVSQLNPTRFNFIADPNTTVDGFLAHQVQEVVPEAITGQKDEVEEYEITPAVLDDEGNVVEEAVMGTRPVYQGIDQSKLVPLLVGAIQELKAEIELLKSK